MTTSMDLNNSNMYLEHTRSDTTLRLDCFGYGGSRNNNGSNNVMHQKNVDDGCKLLLGLGPTSSMYSDDYYDPVGSEGSKRFTTLLNQGLSSCAGDSILKLGLSRCNTGEISNVIEFSGTTDSSGVLHHFDQRSFDGIRSAIPVADEGSTSAKTSGGYMSSLLLAPRTENNQFSLHCHMPELSSPSAISELYSRSTLSEQTIAATSSERRTSNAKRCKFPNCSKGARGATGLCIGHGGGERCQKPGCNKGAESRTAYCKAHGGGKRCQHLGCTKSAEGRTDYCIAHGGGRRCGSSGCTRAARGKTGLCIRHGGGKRCEVEGCSRSAEGQVGLCISHGGGRRCQFPTCTKGAQGSTIFCKAHGGGKRCVFAGCTKGAEGSTPLCKAHGGGKRCLFDGGGICPKSVHGGTNFCVAHGGGKRCVVPGCTKSARGCTDCCVRHGGGKRCRIENCGKSAQGSTDYCKAHGGGKRCVYGEGKCEKFARGKGGLCAAHSSLVQGKETNKRVMIEPGLFHGLVGSSSSMASMISNSIHSIERVAKKQQLIPPQVLVPMSMKASSTLSSEKQEQRSDKNKRFEFVVPEGRVHGGGLMSLLGQNLNKPII